MIDLHRTQYKDLPPSETIRNIQRILAKVGVKLKVQTFKHSNGCHSCRLCITSHNLSTFDIGVNGKGTTRLYALASAYGELMERLQNKALFRDGLRYAVHDGCSRGLRYKRKTLKFLFAPDERLITMTASKMKQILRKWFPNTCRNVDVRGVCCSTIMLPFERIGDSTKMPLPVEMIREICGTTGMCAGNSKTEAVTQGLYEILERFVLQQIYAKHCILPEIDLSVFAKTEIGRNLLEDAHKDGLEYRVKDCSLGGRFPVLGLLIVNRKSGEISFRLGADYNIITALERCYTETYQGGSVSRNVFRQPTLRGRPTANDYKKSCENGTGSWPAYLLDIIEKDNQFPHQETRSSAEAYEVVVERLQAQGYAIYCRDNSFLGFPAFHLYVPGLSDVYSTLIDINECVRKRIKLRNAVPLLWKIPELEADDIKHLLPVLESAEGTINLHPWIHGSSAKKYSRLLLAGCALSVGDVNVAIKAMHQLKADLENHGVEMPTYYKAYISILESRGNSSARIRLMNLYGEPLVSQIEAELMRPRDNFMQLLPRCFNCKRCSCANVCCYSSVVALESSIQAIQIGCA